MPRAMLSIRYILFNLDELEREDTFRLKRFQQLKREKVKKQLALRDEGMSELKEEVALKDEAMSEVKEKVALKDEAMSKVKEKVALKDEAKSKVKEKVALKDGAMSEVKEKVTVKPLEVKFEDKKEDKPLITNEFNELGYITQEIDIPNIMEMIEESLKESNITFNDVPQTDKNEIKNKGEHIDEPRGIGTEGKICPCPPLFMEKPKVFQTEIPDPIFIVKSDKKIQEIKPQKEDEIKTTIPREVPPCCSEILLTWLKKYLEDTVSECVCNLPKNKKEDIAACSQNIHKYARDFSKLSVDDSIFSVNSKFEDKLGSYESEYKEVIKVSRFPNEDGTVRQKRKIVTVRTDKRNPMKTKPVKSQNYIDNDQSLVCSCSYSSSQSEESTSSRQDKINYQSDNDKRPQLFYPATDTKSEPVCSKCQWDKSNLRSCISCGSVKNATKMNTITCFYPSFHRVNIIINDNDCEDNNIIKETRLPLVSSISVNFCDMPKNIMFDLRGCQGRDCQGVNMETNQQSKYVINTDLSKVPEVKKTVSTCMCGSLQNEDFETAEKGSQSFNKVGVEVDGMFKNAATCSTSTTYIFNSVVLTKTNHLKDDRTITAFQSHDFSYIFSRVEKVRHDLLDKKIEETHPDVNTDTFFKECITRTTMFAYILSSYQRIEIENMVKRACFDIPDFPYIFSKISTNTPYISCNTKSVDIGDLFNIACKRSYSCTYIFNHLKNIQINAMIKHSCMNKVDFPYIFSTVKTEIEDQPNNDATLRTAEIENMFKNIHKPVTDFTYILNHVNTVKIDNMFKEACKHHQHFPYVFSNVINRHGSREKLQKINLMFGENTKQSCSFPYIFSSSKKINTNYIPCKNIIKTLNQYSYIFSKVSEAILINDEEFKQTCMPDEKISAVFNKVVFDRSVRTVKQESLTRLKEVSDFFKESARTMNIGKYKYKYVYKNEVANDVDKKTSTDIIYIYAIRDATTSTDNVDCVTKDTVFQQACKHRSEFNYFPNESEFVKTDIVQRASETTLQDIKKIFEGSCDCEIDYTNIKVPQKEEICFAKCGTSDSSKEINIGDLGKPSKKLNVVDINTMFKDSCVRKNEFTYVLNKPTSKQPCELARRTTDLRLQQVSQFEDIVKKDWGHLNITSVKNDEPNQFTKTPNLIKIDDTIKNSFTCVLKNLEDTVSCELGRRTSDLRHREVENLFNSSKQEACGFDTCAVCNPERCLNPNYVKIDKMVRKACKQKNEFTYVFTKLGKKPIQLARRTSHLQLHEISKINESNSSKVAEGKVQYTESSKTDFTYLLRKALESMEMIKSNCEKHRNVATFCDTSTYESDNKYLFNKVDDANILDLKDLSRVQKIQQMNKMFKDSCLRSPNPKYNYIFQKVPKPGICTCNRKKIVLKVPCSVSCTTMDYDLGKQSKIESHSTGSCIVHKRQHRFLIEIPSSKDNLGILGIEVMWKPSEVTDGNVAPQSVHVKTIKRSAPNIGPANSENKIDEKVSWFRSACNKSKKVPSQSNDISLIRRMLDSVKNVYVPFLKPSVPEVKKEVIQPKPDNVGSLMSNSTTSTYSWKSCVMKTCQADIECVEKNISYSGFSYGSSLDFVSYKSEGVGSEFDSAIECANSKENTPCTHMKDSNNTEKIITFDIEIKSGSSLDTKDSVISVKSHNNKLDKNVSDHCHRCGKIKNKPKTTCSKCNLTQNRQVYRFNKSPTPSCMRTQNKILLRRTCSSISITTPKYVNEPKADYWYTLNNRKKVEWTSTESFRASKQNVNICKQPIRKCRSFDDDSCCSKRSRSFH